MDAVYVSALSALAGSVVGGFTFGLMLRKLYGDALVSSEPPLQEVVPVYAMISRIRVLCSPEAVECAGKIMHAALVFSLRRTTRSASCMRS